MPFQVKTIERATENGLPGVFYSLEGESGGIEVWPAFGFNCVRWYTTANGEHRERLYASAKLLQETWSTRSGIPILFPFPNRIRGGRFSWEGREYRLPLNDPAGTNAIHGFACRHRWRVLASGAGADGAWISGEYHAARDAPEALSLWPADHRIRVTYRLSQKVLRVEAAIDNPDTKPLPFGLGYHPYFRLPAGEKQTTIHVPAGEQWELRESLPTGRRTPVDGRTDLREPRPLAGLQLDDVLTALAGDRPTRNRLSFLGAVGDASGKAALQVWGSPSFREVVVFTPPHREAVCIEPYTCVTDAINLQPRGIDAGLQLLAPGERWSAVVELVLD